MRRGNPPICARRLRNITRPVPWRSISASISARRGGGAFARVAVEQREQIGIVGENVAQLVARAAVQRRAVDQRRASAESCT